MEGVSLLFNNNDTLSLRGLSPDAQGAIRVRPCHPW